MSRLQVDTLLRQAQQAFNANQMGQARSLARRVLEIDARSAPALNLLGQVSFALGFNDEASRLLEQAVAADPRDVPAHLALAELRIYQCRFRDAARIYDKALRLRPDLPRAIAGKADALEQSGQRDKARALLGPWIESGAPSPEMTLVQARLEQHDGNLDALIDLVRRQIERGGARGAVLWHLYSLLGKALEKSNRPGEAFDAYRRCNESMGARFDSETWVRDARRIIEVFSAERMAGLPRAGHGTTVPVFIVGMPRSGSTLVETIIDAHPQAHGAGELAAMQVIVNDMALTIGSSLGWPGCVADFEPQDVDLLAATYLEQLTALAPRALRITDKYLLNYRHLGLIELLLPEARVIHCRRHPLDTCLSCYCEGLSPAAHPYTTDLEHLGTVYLEYDRLMTHWRSVLSLPVLDVQYERLVADPQAQTRRIIEFCDLPWDDRCLRYYDTGRVVRTASYDQVNRPIYGSSVGRHLRFREQLEPLRRTLVEGGLPAASLAEPVA